MDLEVSTDWRVSRVRAKPFREVCPRKGRESGGSHSRKWGAVERGRWETSACRQGTDRAHPPVPAHWPGLKGCPPGSWDERGVSWEW